MSVDSCGYNYKNGQTDNRIQIFGEEGKKE